jgi:hypothetical protein
VAIIRRDGKYGVRVYDRRAKGQRWVGTFDRLKDAKRAEADATDVQRPVATRTLTVARWVERWLDDYARPSPATRRTYRYATSQIRDDLGDVLLAAVDRPQARALASRWPRGTMRVRTMFGDAVRDGLIVTNPFAGLRLETQADCLCRAGGHRCCVYGPVAVRDLDPPASCSSASATSLAPVIDSTTAPTGSP